MYKISHVNIDQFWHRFDASCGFNQDINIIIGKNGTGKTTFMNILQSVLTVDIDGIIENDFESATILLVDDGRKKTISVKKVDKGSFPFVFVEYKISRTKYIVRYLNADDKRMVKHYKRRAYDESSEVRAAMSDLVSISSLSVYRLRSSDDYEVRDSGGLRLVSPVDYRLSELMQRLTQYQLELSQQARVISNKLQKDVLASILYSKEDSFEGRIHLEFDKEREKRDLVSAFSRLNALDAEVRRKISTHVDAIDVAISAIRDMDRSGNSASIPEEVDFESIEALRKTRRITEMSLLAEKDTEMVFGQLNKFIKIIKSFITDKDFVFQSGRLAVKTKHGEVGLDNLSSGEKQLLILLTETLLQNEKPYIYLADEPELSLHIEWQRKIIPAIRELNLSSQIIAATHSPEVAAGYPEAIFDMEELVNAEN